MGCINSKNTLTKEDLESLKDNTRYEEKTIKKWNKRFHQICPNGKMTQDSFVDMYKMFFPRGNAEEFCNQMFKTFDTDKIGYLNFKQFILAINTTNSGSAEEKLKAAFRQCWVESGQVQGLVLTNLRLKGFEVRFLKDSESSRFGIFYSGSIQYYFRMYDLDSNGKLDLEEMTKIVVDIYVMQLGYSMIGVVTTTAKKIFSKMDKNGDGYLSEDEFVMGCLQDEKLHMLMPLLSVPYPTGQT